MCTESRSHLKERCWCYPVVQHIGDADIVEHNTDSELAEVLNCMLNHKPIHISTAPDKVFEIMPCEVCGGWHLVDRCPKALHFVQDIPLSAC
jgi:hypothetical protein